MAREMEKRIEDVCSRILISSRNELYIHLRFFDVALSAFTYVMGEQNGELGTDGVGIYYDPGYLGGL
ncbi:MAG TPA: metallopeptidase, partial [Candidatus Blautia merdigallinarum]|nr:metallopeptidase [Candidatus Blautia merdigallinarum]